MSHSAIGAIDSTPRLTRSYAWSVFALTFALLVSDYMSRQVLNAVFPLLKTEWALADAQLGLLSGVVALMVGLLTFPLSLLADRFGRVRSLVLMAMLWSVATLACGVAKNFDQMLFARLCVGIGEAACGSVGAAVVVSVFPAHLRATVTGAFMAGGMFGSVLGMAAGGVLAQHFGWRWSFAGMALFGVALAAVYPFVVRESRLKAGHAPRIAGKKLALASLFDTRSVVMAYIGSGLQLFIGASLMAWMPSFLNRYYDLSTDRAGVASAALVLIGGIGMIVCGWFSDKVGRYSPVSRLSLAIILCVLSFVLLTMGFSLPAGPLQLAFIAAGMFVAAGTSGPAGAMVADLTHAEMHGTAFATMALANNLLGLAPGPFLTGALADHGDLGTALQIVPAIGLAAACAFAIGRRTYLRDVERTRSTSSAP